MQTAQELNRRPSPASRPFGLAFHDGNLWMGSWDTDRIYVIDPQSWKVQKEFQSPGRPYGIAAYAGEFRVVVAHGEEDDRYLYRLTPDGGFDLSSKTACPDMTGSHLAVEGTTIYLGQMHYHRILALNADLSVERTIELPTPRSAGFRFGEHGRFYMISADEEFENLEFGTIDIAQSQPRFESIRPLPSEARTLAYDGSQWWTSLRDEHEIASFTV